MSLNTSDEIHACPWHTSEAFDIRTMPRIVDKAVRVVREHDADAIAAVGHSGLVIAGAVAYVARVPVFAVRKPGEEKLAVGSANYVSAVAHHGPAQRWLWLDDFIGSGGTFRNAVKRLWERKLIASPAPAAIIQYNRWPDDRTAFAMTTNDPYDQLHLRRDYPGVALPDSIPAYGLREVKPREW